MTKTIFSPNTYSFDGRWDWKGLKYNLKQMKELR